MNIEIIVMSSIQWFVSTFYEVLHISLALIIIAFGVRLIFTASLWKK